MSLCVRFIENNSVRQGFLQFLPLTNTTGKELGNIIVKGLNDFGVNCKNLTGQGYNGANAMSGAYRGAQAIIRVLFGVLRIFGKSLRKSIRRHYMYNVHCSAHCLNLAVSSGCNIPSIKICIIVQNVCCFLSFPKRQLYKLKLQNYNQFLE